MKLDFIVTILLFRQLLSKDDTIVGYRTLGRGTVGRGTVGRERKTRVDSRSGDLHRVDSRSGDLLRVDSRSGALMHAIATLIR